MSVCVREREKEVGGDCGLGSGKVKTKRQKKKFIKLPLGNLFPGPQRLTIPSRDRPNESNSFQFQF